MTVPLVDLKAQYQTIKHEVLPPSSGFSRECPFILVQNNWRSSESSPSLLRKSR